MVAPLHSVACDLHGLDRSVVSLIIRATTRRLHLAKSETSCATQQFGTRPSGPTIKQRSLVSSLTRNKAGESKCRHCS